MSDSVDTPIISTGWTEIQQGSAGMITNVGGRAIIYREAAVDPGAGVVTGHILNPTEAINYTLTAGQKVFARTTSADGVGGDVVVSEV